MLKIMETDMAWLLPSKAGSFQHGNDYYTASCPNNPLRKLAARPPRAVHHFCGAFIFFSNYITAVRKSILAFEVVSLKLTVSYIDLASSLTQWYLSVILSITKFPMLNIMESGVKWYGRRL